MRVGWEDGYHSNVGIINMNVQLVSDLLCLALKKETGFSLKVTKSSLILMLYKIAAWICGILMQKFSTCTSCTLSPVRNLCSFVLQLCIKQRRSDGLLTKRKWIPRVADTAPVPHPRKWFLYQEMSVMQQVEVTPLFRNEWGMKNTLEEVCVITQRSADGKYITALLPSDEYWDFINWNKSMQYNSDNFIIQ